MNLLVPQGSHITRKGRGTYRYRRRLPGDPGREIALSLRTRNYREAEHLAALLDQSFVSALARARKAMSSADSDLNTILRGYLRDALAADLDQRLAARPGMPVFAGDRPDLERTATDLDLECLGDRLEEAREALAERDTGAVSAEVADLMDRNGLPEAERYRLALGLLEAHVRYYETAIKRTLGAAPLWYSPDDTGPPPAPATAPAPPPPKPAASALADPFFVRRERRDRATHQVMGQERGTLRRFLEVCGDRPVIAYHRGDISRFLDTLRRLPTTYGKSPKDKDKTLADIIAEADAKGAERLTDKTVKRHLSALAQFFRYAVDCGHLGNQDRRDLVEDHRFREERGARDQRDAWTPEELTKLFASPVWTGCLSKRQRSTPGQQIIRDARFWLPILALYHGARLEELADLYRRDVWCDAGTWAIRIVETKGNPESGDRRLKTENAERVVPLHPEVIRLGFLEYVTERAPGADDPLFPDLKPQGGDLKRGPRMTRWFVEYRKAVGLFRPGISMHAFRHTAITRLTDKITDYQQVRHRDALMGHSSEGSEGSVRYDKGPGLKAVAETLALLRYPELDLSRLYADR